MAIPWCFGEPPLGHILRRRVRGAPNCLIAPVGVLISTSWVPSFHITLLAGPLGSFGTCSNRLAVVGWPWLLGGVGLKCIVVVIRVCRAVGHRVFILGSSSSSCLFRSTGVYFRFGNIFLFYPFPSLLVAAFGQMVTAVLRQWSTRLEEVDYDDGQGLEMPWLRA